MPDQHSDKAPVTFRDVAACFSEEEWKLLHEWQKELYKNVMKEIQQALLSLGPLIATSVFSVRAKENEDLCCMDHQDSKRRNGMTPPPSDTVVNCDVLFTINREESQYLIEPPDGDGRESNDGLSTGFPSFNSANTLRMEQDLNAGVTDNPDAKGGESSTGTRTGDAAATEIVVFSIKEEGDTYSIDHQGFEKRESISAPTGFPPFSTESEASVMNPINAGDKECCPVLNSEFQLFNPDKSAEGGESNPHLNLTGDVGISPFASFNIKEEEGGSSSMDHQDSKRNESVGNPKGDPVVISVLPQHIINKEETHFHEDQGADRKQTGVPLAISILSQPGAHEEETHSREEQEVVGINKGCQPHTGTMKEKDTDPATSCAKSFTRKGNRLLHQKIYTSERSFSCPQCMKRFTQKAQLLNHQRIHKGDRPFSYTECGKSFHQKKDIVKHQRIHTGEKPFYCTECGKRFNSKPHLKRHQVIHSRQKSFHCTKCEKGFNRKENLQRHEKLHTQRSFCCTQCPLSFHLKGRLLRHQIIHTKVIGYSCSECKKSFTRKGNLVLHQKIHTKDAPFFCSECKKSFTRKGNLVVHQRIHTKDAPFSCSECKKSFARKGYLVLHQRTHTKERSLFPHSVKTALV